MTHSLTPNRNVILALAVAHLAFFQLFLFANTDFAVAESLLARCHRAITPSAAAPSSSNPQSVTKPGAIHVSLPHHR